MGERRSYLFGEVVTNHDARRVPVRSTERKSGPYPYYGASGIVDFVDGYLFDGSYLLVAEDGENLRTRKTPIAFMAEGRFWVNNHAHIVQGNELASTKYLGYALSMLDISGYLSGSTQPKLTQNALNRVKIELPERNYQEAVVEMLGALVDKISSNERIADIAFDLLQILWSSASAGTADKKTVSSIASLDKGLSYKGAGLGSGMPLVNLGNFNSSGRFDESKVKLYSGEFRDSHLVSNGDLVISNTDLTQRREILGQPALVFNESGSSIFSHHVFAVRPFPGCEKDKLWLYAAFRDKNFRDRAKTFASGTTVAALPREAVLGYAVPWPGDAKRKEWSATASSLIDVASEKFKENSSLAQLRDTLLPKLMSGEIRVKDAERLVEEAT